MEVIDETDEEQPNAFRLCKKCKYRDCSGIHKEEVQQHPSLIKAASTRDGNSTVKVSDSKRPQGISNQLWEQVTSINNFSATKKHESPFKTIPS
jgi:hypothetical protein